MNNRKKYTKDVYFGKLGYDIAVYAKYSLDLSRKTTHLKLTKNAEGEGDTPDE